MESKIRECMDFLDNSVKLSPRLNRIREVFFSSEMKISAERAVLYTRSFMETEALPTVVRRAKALEKILSEMTIYVKPGDLLVGNLGPAPRVAPVFPEFSVNWIKDELNGKPVAFWERTGDRFTIDDEDRRQLEEFVLPYWSGKNHEDTVMAMLPEETKKACWDAAGSNEYCFVANGDGHTIPDYIGAMETGLEGMIEKARKRIGSLDLTDPDDLRQLPFLQSVIIVNRAVIAFAGRYADMLDGLAEKEPDKERREELACMAKMCRRIPAKPARTFYEAVQMMLFINVPVQIESNGHSISFGRADQYLYPYFCRDIDAGILDVGSAFEIMSCLWMKVTEFAKLRDYTGSIMNAGNPMYQNLTIGGQTLDGRDAVNELSYLALACTKKLKMTQPALTVRWFSGTSPLFMRECVKVVRQIGSMPSFFNDEIIIPSLLSIGYTYEDACDYGIVGCVEPAPHGMIGGRYGAGMPSFAKWAEIALNGGKDPVSGLTLCPQDKDLTTFESFGEVMDAWKKQCDYFTAHHLIVGNVVDLVYERLTPCPFLSSWIKDCVDRGREIKKGGARYDITGGENVGFISAANALATVKKVIFDDKTLTASQVRHALDTNFEDDMTVPSGEAVRQILFNADSKFGNDNDEADNIAAELEHYYCKKLETTKNTRYGRGPKICRFIPSTATVATNVAQGLTIGATADGRKAFIPVTEGTSAYRGTDIKGPTALMNSYAKLPNIMMSGGQLFNVKLSPSSVDSENGISNWVSLITTLFGKKGMQIQFNIVSAETLRDAQLHPENYRDLIVRVAGFSSYFTILLREVQDDIINRTEHRL